LLLLLLLNAIFVSLPSLALSRPSDIGGQCKALCPLYGQRKASSGSAALAMATCELTAAFDAPFSRQPAFSVIAPCEQVAHSPAGQGRHNPFMDGSCFT